MGTMNDFWSSFGTNGNSAHILFLFAVLCIDRIYRVSLIFYLGKLQ